MDDIAENYLGNIDGKYIFADQVDKCRVNRFFFETKEAAYCAAEHKKGIVSCKRRECATA